ncbi:MULTISPECIES: helix-turn-helix domain-containing protein [unclassified Streptomyces]|uniref:helix-turn-helix domain-containing protein n=1 Tax=unclassified Streptomyces TaxID=2593676 RepID=UPI000DBA6C11|nr:MULTISPECIES: helix-turn-helix domain-containing protein [unclassified Streptomyces]MYT71398.1 helix-turn-helix domain-containing protein [Streptomyces sp. SID8367]RAJ82859.1 helix-turn-helix protein [Streptomyces sp. PsTaAH-137]
MSSRASRAPGPARPSVRPARCPDGTWETAQARPHASLRPGVIGYRGFRLAFPGPRARLEAPIGAVTLMLGFEGRVRVTEATGGWVGVGGQREAGGARPEGLRSVEFSSVLSGLTTTPVLGEHDGRLSGVEVLLTPWAAFTMFGTPLHELSGWRVDPDTLGALPEAGVDELSYELGRLSSWRARFGLIDETLGRWLSSGPRPASGTVRAWYALTHSGGAAPVSRIAGQAGWSVRHLENRFREQIGLSPKAAARVLRLQRARRLLCAGSSQVETAAACGYYDQAHLSGEFKAMTGCTPREFFLARGVHVDAGGPPATDRLAGEATSLVLRHGPRTGGALSSHSSLPGASLSKTAGHR